MAGKSRLELLDNADDSEEKDTLNSSEDEDGSDGDQLVPEMAGILSKWTNYIHGWQDRYFVLREGTITYFKSETDRSFGCRGAVSLTKGMVSPHEFDDCRFDISVSDSVWYLRASSGIERLQWLEALDLHMTESGYGSISSLRRQGSMTSILSGASASNASTSSFKRGRGLVEKMHEMETYKDILCKQVDTLQGYFDACTQVISVVNTSVHDLDHHDIDDPDTDTRLPRLSPAADDGSDGGSAPASLPFPASPRTDNSQRDQDLANIFKQHGAHAVDFKGEAITFKATTSGIISSLSLCIDMMAQREETWKRKMDREVDRRKKVEEAYRAALKQGSRKPIVIGGPDYEEGPHCAINDDEFFDAVDASLDKLELEAELKRDRERTAAASHADFRRAGVPPSPTPVTPTSDESSSVYGVTVPKDHSLYTQINETVAGHLRDVTSASEGSDSPWELMVQEGEMRLYSRECVEDGMVCDPMKAVHTIKGVTGHEMCHYFWDLDVRMDWEGTLESSVALEFVSSDTIVTHQVHKRVWPTSQRDALYWSHIRNVPAPHGTSDDDPASQGYWIVCNKSIDHPKALQTKCVRALLNVALICQTIVTPPASGSEVTREDITCKISYSAYVNPGGWAPPAVLRAVYRREYPKFLKRFSRYVTETTASKPILF